MVKFNKLAWIAALAATGVLVTVCFWGGEEIPPIPVDKGDARLGHTSPSPVTAVSDREPYERTSAVGATHRRALEGRLRRGDGTGVRATVVLRSESPVLGQVTVRADATGLYRTDIPATWRRVSLSASNANGYRGELAGVPVAASEVCQLPDLTLVRRISLELSLDVEKDLWLRISPSSSGHIVARLVGTPTSVLSLSRPVEATKFEFRPGHFDHECEVECNQEHSMEWVYVSGGGSPVVLRRETVPTEGTRLQSALRVGNSMCVIGRVVDSRGRPVPGVSLAALVRAPAESFSFVSSDEKGEFYLLVPENASGYVGVRAKVTSSDQLADEAPWSAGLPVTVTCNADSRIIVQLVDQHGLPINHYYLALKNGRPTDLPESFRYRKTCDNKNGIYCTGWESITAGQEIFISVLGVPGKSVYRCPRDVHPSDTPYRILVPEVRWGTLKVKYNGIVGSGRFQALSIKLETGQDSPRRSYSFNLSKNEASQGVELPYLLPGSYRTHASGNAVAPQHGAIVIHHGETSVLTIQ